MSGKEFSLMPDADWYDEAEMPDPEAYSNERSDDPLHREIKRKRIKQGQSPFTTLPFVMLVVFLLTVVPLVYVNATGDSTPASQLVTGQCFRAPETDDVASVNVQDCTEPLVSIVTARSRLFQPSTSTAYPEVGTDQHQLVLDLCVERTVEYGEQNGALDVDGWRVGALIPSEDAWLAGADHIVCHLRSAG